MPSPRRHPATARLSQGRPKPAISTSLGCPAARMLDPAPPTPRARVSVAAKPLSSRFPPRTVVESKSKSKGKPESSGGSSSKKAKAPAPPPPSKPVKKTKKVVESDEEEEEEAEESDKNDDDDEEDDD